MSWTFQLQKINRSFEHLAAWYTEFMNRTEACFQSFHQRLLQLEERQTWPGPSDEQVERVLRKILAEKFANPGIPTSPAPMSNDEPFVANSKELAFPRPIVMDIASLVVDPDSVPSKAYAETMEKLTHGLTGYPRIEMNQYQRDDTKDIKSEMMDRKKPRYSNSV